MQTSSINLLTLPCAGASATMYLRWRRLLPKSIRIVPVELPGRGSRLGESFVEDFEQLVAQLCEEQAAAMQGRYALFGHSMGALLVYGMAQRQRALARPPPQRVFASACPAPSRRRVDRFAGKNDDAALIADLRKQGGTPEEVLASEELLRITLDVLGADYRVCESFRYQLVEPLTVPLHTFGGRTDDISASRLADWQRETTGPFHLHWFDGGHFFIRQQEQPVLSVVSRALFGEHREVGNAAASTI